MRREYSLHGELVSEGYLVHEKLPVRLHSFIESSEDISFMLRRMGQFSGREFKVLAAKHVPEALTEEERASCETRYFVVYKKEPEKEGMSA